MPVVKLPMILMAGINIGLYSLYKYFITVGTTLVYISRWTLILGPSLRFESAHKQSDITSLLFMMPLMSAYAIVGTAYLTASYLGLGSPLTKLVSVHTDVIMWVFFLAVSTNFNIFIMHPIYISSFLYLVSSAARLPHSQIAWNPITSLLSLMDSATIGIIFDCTI